ncbi:MAG TPA: NAD(P)-dependent oxidoreductase [Solirubrobacteraceae bacterium]|jgi:3-hydroxyisobutyrate dehydrogenase-like beta-hydroxyacid dehydrogenase
MRVAFLGLGIMGSRMAANLREAGHDLVVWNRTREKAEAFGGRVAATPKEAAADAEVVITMVVDGPQVERVLLGEDGAADGAREGTLFVDMSTIGPAAARAIGAALRERGLKFVDAPVTGSSPKAEAGTLTIMAGGDAPDVERARALFEAMGETIVHAGALGQGQMVKLINNSLAAANTVALAQALLAGKATGADLDALVAVMSAGSAGSAMLDLKAKPMREHDFSTLFKTEHMLKDVRLCLEETQAAGVPFPAAADAREILTATVGRGLGEADFGAVLAALEDLSGIRL